MTRTRFVSTILVVTLAAVGCGNTAQGHAATLTSPTVTVATANGSGCPAGTVTTAVSPDGGSVTAVYTAFTARAGTGSVSGESRRNCQFSIQISAPGQRWSVTSVSENGAIDIPAGGTAVQDTSYYLQGTSTTTTVNHSASGPMSGPWVQSDPAPFAAPCGTTRNLNINVALRVTSPGPAASLSLNGATPGTTINLGYATCP